MTSKKNIKAGDDSKNIQADTIIINNGIDEKRAREVFNEMSHQLKDIYTREALEIANSRVRVFEDKLMSKMEKIDNSLSSFSDPSFQMLITKAQKTAACTNETADYDLLSELLIQRINEKSNRDTQTGIDIAVDIIDKISDAALLCLTVAHSAEYLIPKTGNICEGLDILNSLFEKIIYNKLPQKEDWLDHLELLRAIRIIPFAKLRKTHDIFHEKLSGYCDNGIKKNSDSYEKALNILTSNNLPTDLLVEHSFNDDFVRINIRNRNCIESILLEIPINIGDRIVKFNTNINQDQIEAINSIYDLYLQDDSLKKNNILKFNQEWDKRHHLKILKEWRDSINTPFIITKAGKVLAHSNAQRLDSQIPAMS